MVVDPSTDPRSNYSYGGGEINRGDLVIELQKIVKGEVRFDNYTRHLYATDASIYEVTPIGVVFPKCTDDVAKVVAYCADRKIPILPRGGGTSLAGQAVNEAVVLDFTKHMDGVLEIDPIGKRIRVQSGAYLGSINKELKPNGLKFAPDPAWADKSAIGGAIGNNSTGSHSLVYEKTDAYIESCEVVLSDGTIHSFGEISVEDLKSEIDSGSIISEIYSEIYRIFEEFGEEISDKYPDLNRNVSGYNLKKLYREYKNGKINLAHLICGSEGTLAIVTEATLILVDIPKRKEVILFAYENLRLAMEDVSSILDHGPSAIEVMDKILLDLARETIEFQDITDAIPNSTEALLLVEFYAEGKRDGKEKIECLRDQICPKNGDIESKITRAKYAIFAQNEIEQGRFWKMRKSGLPILLSRTSDEKHIAFVEDLAIPAKHLPEYVEKFQEILDIHGTYASFYAHAGPGVLHVRPLINTKTEKGIEIMNSVSEMVTDLVIGYGGAISGEHGDGRSRTQWNEKLYGEKLWKVFRDLKTSFDPEWILNPGQVCGDVKLTENLRHPPGYELNIDFEPKLNWSEINGFEGMVDLCHGCGGCRGGQIETGGVMCPTFRASKEESTSTRGRANLLRLAMSGELEGGAFNSEFMHEVMDLCIGCKGCKKDCPSGVDMAKLKIEITNEYRSRNGTIFRDRIFSNIGVLMSIGSSFSPLSNIILQNDLVGTLLEKTIGIGHERKLPIFHRETFAKWATKDTPSGSGIRKVLVVPDIFTNYVYPNAGIDSVKVLKKLGFEVQVMNRVMDTGRASYSKGFIEMSRKRAEKNIELLVRFIRQGWDVVMIEPSEAEMISTDYLDLLRGEDVSLVSKNTYDICEYIDLFGENIEHEVPKHKLIYHGHCHQKASGKSDHAANMLRKFGYTVKNIDSGCCGMAGSFGYESEHVSMSSSIGQILFDQIETEPDGEVIAPGASCRSQLSNYLRECPAHPIEKLAEILI
jgi:FAD/FMN-containing dehydrogenase/Fe-S oxidoreductase